MVDYINTIELGFSPESRPYAFNPILKKPSAEFMRYFNRRVRQLGATLQRELKKGSQSSNPLRKRKAKQRKRTGAYFAANVRVTEMSASQVRKYPVGLVISAGENSVAYEASHGQMTRALLIEGARG